MNRILIWFANLVAATALLLAAEGPVTKIGGGGRNAEGPVSGIGGLSGGGEGPTRPGDTNSAPIGDQRTFYWTFTSDTAETDLANTTPLYRFGAAISTEQFYSEPSSFAIDPDQTFSLVERYNDTDNNYWTKTPMEGTVRLRFRYEGAWPSGTDVMLFQLTGKSINNPSVDTDDAVQVYFRNGVTNNVRMRYLWANGAQNRIVTLNHTPGVPDSTWHLLECKWRTNQSPYMSISINGGTAATTTTVTGNTACVAWHLILIGNDLNSKKTVHIDDFEIYNYWIP